MSKDELGKELMGAVGNGSLDDVKAIIAKGASASYELNIEGVWGAHNQKSVIHVALYNEKEGSIPIIKFLLENGASVNCVYSNYDWRGCGSQNTAFEIALQRALETDCSELLALFLKYGGDPNKENVRDTHSMRTDARERRSPIHTAASKENPAFLRLLLESGVKVEQIHEDIMSNEYGRAENRQETALHIACDHKLIDSVALLLKYGANVNKERKWLANVNIKVNSPTDNPRDSAFISPVKIYPVVEYPIHIALRSKNQDLVALLVSFGADTSLPYKYGDTTKTCVELCEGDKALLEALQTGWSPSIHKYFPQPTRDAIRTFLLCVKRLGFGNSVFPRDSQIDICRYIANV